MLKPRTLALLREERLRLLDAIAHIDYLLDWAKSVVAVPAEPKKGAVAKKKPDERRSHRPTGLPRGRHSKYDWVLGEKLYGENKRVEDIADRLGCSKSAVKGHAARGKWKRNRKPDLPLVSPGKSVRCSSCQHDTTKNPCEHCHTKLPTFLAAKLK